MQISVFFSSIFGIGFLLSAWYCWFGASVEIPIFLGFGRPGIPMGVLGIGP
jgi:hypothetical protein